MPFLTIVTYQPERLNPLLPPDELVDELEDELKDEPEDELLDHELPELPNEEPLDALNKLSCSDCRLAAATSF